MLPVVVYLPGLMCDAAVWRDVRAALALPNEEVVAEYGLAQSLDGMARIALEQAPVGPLVLVGHSMGGRVAMLMAQLAPERIAGVCLLDTSHVALADGADGERERDARLRLLTLARREGVAAMARVWAEPMVHASRLKSPLFDEVVGMVSRRTAASFAAQITALLARTDMSRLLQELAVPVAIGVGREDSWSPPSVHEAMARLVPNARFQVFDTCGHMSPMEQPEAVAALVRRCLAAADNGVA